nr:NeuD/PglB/VioB family sugar acetyltransferase [Allomuricauda sp.]
MPNRKNIVLIGAGGHAKVIMDIVERENKYVIVGLIDSFKKKGDKILDYEIIGNENELSELMVEHNFDSGIIAIGNNWTRKIFHKKISTEHPDFKFVSAVHPKSIIGKNCVIGYGTVIMPGVVVNSDAVIKNFCIVNTSASVGHDSFMENYSSLAPKSALGGGVKIGKCTAVGMGAMVLQTLTIGDNCIIGACSLVNKNVSKGQMIYGVPGKVIRKVRDGEAYLKRLDARQIENVNSKINFEVITEKEKWDGLLSDVETYDFYHTYDYHWLSKNPEEKPVLLKYQKKKILIGIPLLIREIEGTPFFDATSVYGYAGPISKNIPKDFDNNDLLNCLNSYFESNNIVTVFSRLNPFVPNQENILENYGEIAHQGKVVNIDLTLSPELLRQGYQRRLKGHINKARRECNVRRALDDVDFQKFIDVYYENMDRVKARKYYYFSKQYFHKITNSSDFETVVLLAEEKSSGKVIAGSMFIKSNNIVQYHLSGSKEEYLNLNPIKLLIDEMRLLAQEENFDYMNLGGGLRGQDNDSLFRFKSSFSNDHKDFNLWKLVVNPNLYDKLISDKNMESEESFFPLYRVES